MNPQDNSNKDFDPNSPMNQMGYGSTGIAYENYDDEAMKKANEPQDASAVPINVINAVNANGIVSGRKVVDESWQKMAICAIVIAAGCLIGVIVSVIIANSLNKEIANLKIEKSSSDNALSLIYSTLGVSDNGSAINQITSQIESGDLVFYGNGYVDHVALYIGDGKIIHASGAATGIKISNYDYEQPAAIGTFME